MLLVVVKTNSSLQASKEDQHAVGDALGLFLIKDRLVLAPLDDQLAAVNSAGGIIGDLPLTVLGSVGLLFEEVSALDVQHLVVAVGTPHAVVNGAFGVLADEVVVGLVVERDAVAAG